MGRTHDDTWDINESVGATALGVAGGRAAETNSADPLINDPYAQLFLEAAGNGIWRIYLDEELPAELVDIDPRFKERMLAMMSYMDSRTKYFDEFFLDAAANGIRQAVILAAGLDARAWRLAWPTGSVCTARATMCFVLPRRGQARWMRRFRICFRGAIK